MGEPWGHSANEISGHKMTNTVQCHLYEAAKVVKFIDTESRMMVARGRGKGEWGAIILWVQSFNLARWKNSREGWWWLHSKVTVLGAPELYT